MCLVLENTELLENTRQLCLVLENARKLCLVLENVRQSCLVHCLVFFLEFYVVVVLSNTYAKPALLCVFHLNAFVIPLECNFHSKIFCYTNFLYYYSEGALRTAELALHTDCIMEVSEFFFSDKIFHWKSLLFDFYFVNFSVLKKC